MDAKYYHRLNEMFGMAKTTAIFTIDKGLRPATILTGITDTNELKRLQIMLNVKKIRIERYPFGQTAYMIFRNTEENADHWARLVDLRGLEDAFDTHVGTMLGYVTPAPLSQLQHMPRWSSYILISYSYPSSNGAGSFRIAPQVLQGDGWTEEVIVEVMEPLRAGVEMGMRALGFDLRATTKAVYERETTSGGKRGRRSRRMRLRLRSRKSRRTKRRVGHVGGSWHALLPAMIAEAAHIQAEATSMDRFNRPFAIAGSVAVAVYLYNILQSGKLSKDQQTHGESLFAALAKPDDLDFKYRRQGPLFSDFVQGGDNGDNDAFGTPNNPFSLSLNMSRFRGGACRKYVDLAGFRTCEPEEHSPIFRPHSNIGITKFSKVDFDAPAAFALKPMRISHVAGLDLLEIKDLIFLYEKHAEENDVALPHKLNVLNFVREKIERT